MTAQTITVAPRAIRTPFLGFGTLLRKELTEWSRGRGALAVAGISIFGAAFTTIIPFIAPKDQPGGPVLSMDPTANVLLGWGGLTAAVVAILATMSLISGERDRGTLPWILTKPVSPLSVIAAKWTAAMLMYGSLAVVIPLAVSAGIATVVYGAVPDLRTVALFGALYLALPAFYIAVTVTLGTFVKSTGGVAGIAFGILLLPVVIGSVVPILADLSPTSIGTWALATATGAAASSLTPIAWLVAMVAMAVGARFVFNHQEF